MKIHQPMPGPFPAIPISKKGPGNEVVAIDISQDTKGTCTYQIFVINFDKTCFPSPSIVNRNYIDKLNFISS